MLSKDGESCKEGPGNDTSTDSTILITDTELSVLLKHG